MSDEKYKSRPEAFIKQIWDHIGSIEAEFNQLAIYKREREKERGFYINEIPEKERFDSYINGLIRLVDLI